LPTSARLRARRSCHPSFHSCTAHIDFGAVTGRNDHPREAETVSAVDRRSNYYQSRSTRQCGAVWHFAKTRSVRYGYRFAGENSESRFCPSTKPCSWEMFLQASVLSFTSRH
jgi:hypothetical protein